MLRFAGIAVIVDKEDDWQNIIGIMNQPMKNSYNMELNKHKPLFVNVSKKKIIKLNNNGC